MKTILGVKGLALSEYAIAANAILGIRDSGKTYTATEASEELFEAGVPFIWLDPIGVAHNLRIPGKGRGYPVVVAGGKHGDLPLTVKGVGDLVRSAMKANVSLVLDLFSVELSKSDWRRIVKEVCEILLHENSEHGLRHVFIEEAAEFVPQRVTDGQTFAAVEKLVRMGGNSKVGITLINQRSADLNKSVLELCANVFVHRQTGKNTLQDLKKWLGLIDPTMEKKITASLPDLKSGQCWVMSNELKTPELIKVPEKNSLHPDRRAATMTKAEAANRQPVPADAFVAQMKAAMVEKAKPQTKSAPSSAVQKINTLDQKATDGLMAAAREEGAQAIRDSIPGMLDAQHKASFGLGVDAGANAILKGMRDVAVPGEPLYPARKPIPAITAALRAKVPPGTTMDLATAGASAAQPPTAQHKRITPSAHAAPCSVRDRVLGALAELAAIGIDQPPRIQVAFLARYKHDGVPNFRNTAGALRSEGLLEYPDSNTMRLTAAGRDAAPPVDEPLTTEGLHARLLGLLDGVHARILPHIIEAYPAAMDRNELAKKSGYAHAGVPNFRNSLGRLRSLGFVSYPDSKTVRAEPTLFLEDR